MKEETIFDAVKRIILEQTGANIEDINLGARLTEDLGFDDLDRVEVVMAVEDWVNEKTAANVFIDDDVVDRWKTVNDIVICAGNLLAPGVG